MLVVGGVNSGTSAEVYDPATGTWAVMTQGLLHARANHTTTLLHDGTVLIVGTSIGTNRAEILDPDSGDSEFVWGHVFDRSQHTATLLEDGRVLVAGGIDADGNPMATAEIFDPETRNWSTTGPLENARFGHTATYIPKSGTVVVAGGCAAFESGECTDVLASAEAFDPTTGTWAPTGSLLGPRFLHTASILRNGSVMITGGLSLPSQSQYADELGTWKPPRSTIGKPGHGIWLGAPSMPRIGHSATTLPDGRTIIAGGYNGVSHLSSAEMYSPPASRGLDRIPGSWSHRAFATQQRRCPMDGSWSSAANRG